MRVENHLAYAAFDYHNGADVTENGLRLGDIVFSENEYDIGVIIQIHDSKEFRTDMWGNTSISECRLATSEEILKYRPSVYSDGIFTPKIREKMLDSDKFLRK